MPTHEFRRAKAAGLPLRDEKLGTLADYLVQLKQQLDRIEDRLAKIERGMTKEERK